MGGTALIGYTGFVGAVLDRQYRFDDRYNSSNIDKIRGKSYHLVFCAGARAEKWRANTDPEADWRNLTLLMEALAESEIGDLVLISTVDVYPDPVGVDEETPIEAKVNHPYGKHRYEFERFCIEHFSSTVVRLPGLFGPGLKKNVIYDLLNNNGVDQIHADSIFQFYDLKHLRRDIDLARRHAIRLINIATEPSSVAEIAREALGVDFGNRPSGRRPGRYDMRSIYASLYGGRSGYLYDRMQVFTDLREFVRTYPSGR
ncbi:MAG: NAD-dependent epimerase/dehydratase family protein [bacterium]